MGKLQKLANRKDPRIIQLFTSYLQILKSDSGHTTPSVLLFSDHHRILINCGEGLQRHVLQTGVKLSKIDTLLFTRMSADVLGGLPGLLLSRAGGEDTSDPEELVPVAQLQGPPGMRTFVNTFSKYVNKEAMNVQVTEIAPLRCDTLCAPCEPLNPSMTGWITITPWCLKAQVPDKQSREHEVQDKLPVGNEKDDGEPHQVAEPAAGYESGPGDPPRKRQRVAGDQNHKVPSPESPGNPNSDTHGQYRSSLMYVCQLKDLPGRFSREKAAALGVPQGPLYGQLKSGQAVVLDTGRTVHSEEVMDTPTQLGPVVVVVDCPDLGFLGALQQDHQALQQYQEELRETPPTPRLHLMIHLGPPEVVMSPPYQEWMAGHDMETSSLSAGGTSMTAWQHIIVNARTEQQTLRGAAALQANLHRVHPDLFPLCEKWFGAAEVFPHRPLGKKDEWETPGREGSQNALQPLAVPSNPLTHRLPLHWWPACHLTKYRLMPTGHQGWDLGEVKPPATMEQTAARAKNRLQEVLVRCKQLPRRAEVMSVDPELPGPCLPPGLRDLPSNELAITFLGTSSSSPTSYRNVSGAYLDFFHRGGMLVDCGEDAYGQLRRMFGDEGALARLQSLHCIWISHMHADHHGGLYPLLSFREATLGPSCPPLLVIGPLKLLDTLKEFSSILNFRWRFVTNNIDWARTTPSTNPMASVLNDGLTCLEEVQQKLDLQCLHPFRVHHVYDSWGLTLAGRRGWKVVFSGDTRPCQQVIDAARGALLLVHEATFLDDMQKDAVAKKHSTVSEALEVAKAARVYRTVLTHFSTRYTRMPRISPLQFNRFGVAFDLMTINLVDLPWIGEVLPPVSKMIHDIDDAEGRQGMRVGGGQMDTSL